MHLLGFQWWKEKKDKLSHAKENSYGIAVLIDCRLFLNLMSKEIFVKNDKQFIVIGRFYARDA